MKFKIAFLYSVGFFLTILLMTACQNKTENPTILKAGVNNSQYPTLLTRSEAIRNGKEWDLVQNTYADALNNLRKKPTNFKAALKMVEVFINEARVTGEHGHYYPAALQVVEDILKAKPKSKDIIFQAQSLKASVLLSQHEFAAALEIAQAATQLYQYNAGIYGSLTDAYVELGDYKNAVAAADKMVSIRPDLRSYSRVSYLREIHGDLEGAIEAMQLAVTAGYPGYEQTAWARLTLGGLYEKQVDWEMAKKQYETILQNRPNYAFAIAALGGIEAKKENFAKAEKLLKEACAIIPEVGFYVDLADLYQKTERKTEAQQLLNEIWEMLQDDVNSGHNMNMEYAQIYLDVVQDYDQALVYAMEEYKKRPKNVDVNQLVATALLKKGEKDQAQPYLAVANRINGK